MVYYSGNSQDEFVLNILNHINNGYFIDIGCFGPKQYINSYTMESIGWNGLAFDLIEYEQFSSERKCKFIIGDATLHDYEKIFIDEKVPFVIDYLSIDIDRGSLDVLKKIPFKNFKYKTITIEHDYYRFGDELRKEQREILNNNGYFMLFSDVDAFCNTNTFFEDWWVHPSYVDVNKYKHLNRDKRCNKDIIKDLF